MTPQSHKGRDAALYMLASVRRRRRAGPYSMPHRQVALPALCFVKHGEGKLLLDGIAYRFDPGSLFYFMPGMAVQAELDAPQLDYYIVLLDTVFVSGRKGAEPPDAASLRLPPFLVPGRLLTRESRQLLKRFEKLHEENRSLTQTPSGRSLQHIRLQELLNFIVQETAGREPVKETGTNIERTVKYMKEQYRTKISLNTLADMAGFTPSSYSRAFAKTVGMSPIEFLTGLRVAGAKQLLSRPDCRVKDVSAAVGFESEFYFSRIFKQTVGVSPSLYMKRDRLRVAVASCLALEDNLLSVGFEAAAAVNCFRYPGMDDEEHGRTMAAHLAALRRACPDLIVADCFHAAFEAQLKQIAPVVMLRNDPDWRVNHTRIAELVGQEEEAKRTIGSMEQRERQARLLLGSTLGKARIAIMQVNHKLARLQGTAHHPLNELCYNGLGLQPGGNIPSSHFRQEFTPEWLPALEADYLFIHKNHIRAGCDRIFRVMQSTASWNSIQAVRDDNVHFIPNWFRMSWTPPGRHRIIDELLALAKAGE
ncbi:AraC family transcriptional regulator [Paenibacillus mesophilus]|uniref:helix-turn-helix domain-containing protein n=1 Tax=Paenibacillus mesophilus TaxID=2582849 RepID=UPI00110EF03A|nr:AraC family transcriptional regulator [Paenibacillus mesophilus]TMV48465.1 AraC family transcriptional regulator [Paenibacillus mesophilus]